MSENLASEMPAIPVTENPDQDAQPVETIETVETQAPAEKIETPMPAQKTETRGMRKTRVGVVVSDKMDKTITVAIKTRVKHPLYGKIMNRTSKLKAHDEENACGMGDTVRVMETRPLSKDKRWRLVEILEKAK